MRVLIVGCGSIGRRHLANLLSLAPAEVLAYRVRGNDAEELGRRFGVRAVASLGEGLSLDPDFVLVANPTALHMEVALEAARAGRSLFIEKPLSHSREGADELRRLVREKGLVCLVGYQMRFHPGLRLVRRLLGEGRIGRPLWIRAEVGQYLPDWHPDEDYRQGFSARRALGGGVTLDLSHELDYVRWLLGPVAQVTALGGRIGDLEIDTEDIAEVLLRFESGALGSVHLDYLARCPVRGCRLVGTDGTLEWDYFGNQVRLFEAGSGAWIRHPQEGFERNRMYIDEMAHFLRCLRGEEPPEVDLDQAVEVLELGLGVRRAAQRWEPEGDRRSHG
jgi:predicted dehydrogenase